MVLMVEMWEWLYETADRNDWTLYIIGSWALSFGVFVIMNVFFGCLDIFGLPTVLLRFKIQKEVNVPMSLKKYLWTLLVATFNMTVVVLASLLVAWHAAAKNRMVFAPNKIPTLWIATWHIVLCILINEVAFYYLHRLVHYSPFLYKHIHKIHHDWKAPCSVATFYCHPLEQGFINLGSFILGPALVGAHLSTAWLYWMFGQVITTLSHSGYHFPILPSPERHDYHHLKSRDGYGTIGILDWFHGTEENFKKSQHSKRHFIFCGITPADKHCKDRQD